LVVLAFAVCVPPLGAADKEGKDSPAAAATRDKLQAKVTVDFKDEQLRIVLDDINMQLKAAGQKPIEWKFDTGVSQNQRVTAKGKDKPLTDVLDQMLKGNALGYIVLSKPTDKRLDGHILIKQGRERGYPLTAGPAKEKPKVEEPAKTPPKEKPAEEGDKSEARAASKLKLAKQLIDDGKGAKAKERLEELIQEYPRTKAAEEAKQILKKLKK
jgi:hypothetical protein